jgi:hypothetical protein
MTKLPREAQPFTRTGCARAAGVLTEPGKMFLPTEEMNSTNGFKVQPC